MLTPISLVAFVIFAAGYVMNILDPRVFETKIIGLIGVAGGHTGATLALNALTNVGRNLHAWVLPHLVSIAGSAAAFDAQRTRRSRSACTTLEHML